MKWLQALWVLALYVWLAFGVGMLAFTITHWPSGAKGAELIKLHKGDVDLLGRVIWAEARSEPFEGQCAVAWIILNRLAREPGRFPDTIRGVILQPFAFSCFNSTDPQCEKVKAVSETDPAFVQALHAATAVLTGRVKDPTNGSDHYHTVGMTKYPGWASKMRHVATIGRHRFYREAPVK